MMQRTLATTWAGGLRSLHRPQRSIAAVLFAVLVSVGFGAVIGSDLLLGLVCAFLALSFAAAMLRGAYLWWDLFSVLFLSTVILGYGFANVGFSLNGIPIPLSTLGLAGLGIWLLFSAKPWSLGLSKSLSTSIPAGWVGLFFLVAVLRLIVDVPRWGTLALRDFTLPLETVSYLFLGYWSMWRFGRRRWERLATWMSIVLLGYLALYPFHETLSALGPTVGLQQPVSLLGNFAGAGLFAVAVMFFHAIVRPYGRLSTILAALFLPPLLLFQSRGFYIAIPAAILLTSLLASSGTGHRIRQTMLAVMVIGAVAAVPLLGMGPEGRLGPVTSDFLRAQIRTLSGEVGPGSGSYAHRLQFVGHTLSVVEATPGAWAYGVGFGPDLAGGFGAPGEVQVRKPHDDYLEVFARMGLVGILSFIGLLGSSLVRIARTARSRGTAEARFLWWTFASVSFYLLIAATQPLFSYSYGTLPAFALLGAGLAVRDNTSRSSGMEPSHE